MECIRFRRGVFELISLSNMPLTVGQVAPKRALAPHTRRDTTHAVCWQRKRGLYYDSVPFVRFLWAPIPLLTALTHVLVRTEVAILAPCMVSAACHLYRMLLSSRVGIFYAWYVWKRTGEEDLRGSRSEIDNDTHSHEQHTACNERPSRFNCRLATLGFLRHSACVTGRHLPGEGNPWPTCRLFCGVSLHQAKKAQLKVSASKAPRGTHP